MAENEFLKEQETPNEDKPQEEVVEAEKIKLGEAEYTQDELNNLVSLGKTAKEYEEKWDRKIDTIYPRYLESTKKLSELEKKIEEQQATQPPATPGSPEEVKKQALKQAKDLGLVTVEDINNYIDNRVGAFKLEDDVESLVEDAKEAGKPVPNKEELLNYMADNGIRFPDKAYKLMYEDQLDAWKEKKLASIKPEGLKTQETSTAGETKPPEVKVPTNLESLRSQLRSYMKSQEGTEKT